MQRLAKILILCLWPISLLFANTLTDFVRYLLPSLLFLISITLYDRQIRYYALPILVIPLVEPKLALIPLIYFLANWWLTREKINLKLALIAIIILAIFSKPFFGQTIFKFDYQANQQILQKSQLYNSITLARVFQNKVRVPLDKFSTNLFMILDPNNYFFGFMPRQITIDNQNLNKFPFPALPLVLIGFLNLGTLKRKGHVLSLGLAAILNLSVLTIFDRQDFILWLPLGLIIFHGLEVLAKRGRKATDLLLLATIIFAIPEFLRTLIEFKK